MTLLNQFHAKSSFINKTILKKFLKRGTKSFKKKHNQKNQILKYFTISNDHGCL